MELCGIRINPAKLNHPTKPEPKPPRQLEYLVSQSVKVTSRTTKIFNVCTDAVVELGGSISRMRFPLAGCGCPVVVDPLFVSLFCTIQCVQYAHS